jgi:hypothetical protein
MAGAPSPEHHDSHDLAVSLLPALAEACGGALHDVRWFRTAHQRGGAATGFARLMRDGCSLPVMLKLPVGPDEYAWTTRLSACPSGTWHTHAWTTPQACACVTPRVVASGLELGGHDLAWLVVEKLGENVSPDTMDGPHAREIIGACFAFSQRCEGVRAIGPGQAAPRSPQWDVLIERGRMMCREHGLLEHHRWHDALRRVHKALPVLRARWEARPITTWCHGDLHPGNVLRRVFAEGERLQAGPLALTPPCVLIDLALVHPGHWMEDALYFERQFWGHAEKLSGAKPLSIVAAMRRAAGLATDEHYDQLANTRRVLMAACAPAMMQREGNARYLHTALEMIETLLPQVPH